MNENVDFDVVVVGAGPAGLASAMTLGAYGVGTLVVERRSAPSKLAKSTTVSTRTMELLRRWGLEEETRARAIDAEWQSLATATLAEAASGVEVEIGLPSRSQAAIVSPTSPAAVGQDELEPMLEERLASFAGVQVMRDSELVGIEASPDGGYLLILAGAGGVRSLRARYLIGADGKDSVVRRRLGIATSGSAVIEERLAIHFQAPIWEVVGERRYGGYFITSEPEGRFFFALGRPDRWVFGMHWDSAVDDEGAITDASARRWIREAAGVPDLPIELGRAMPVAYGVGLAERFRKGDAFLIGDAAHRVTPRGGTGLNSAIKDGFDLGWKLGWVLRGWADEGLLESYEGERRPVIEFNTERSMRPDGSLLGNATGLHVDLGGRIAHAWTTRGEALVSTLDLLGDGLTLLTGPNWSGEVAGGPGLPAVAVERLDAIAARTVGLTASGALLARPDGVPVALWNADRPDHAVIARAIASAAGRAAIPALP